MRTRRTKEDSKPSDGVQPELHNLVEDYSEGSKFRARLLGRASIGGSSEGIGSVNDHEPERAFSDWPDWWGPRWLTRPRDYPHGETSSLSVLDLIDRGTVDPWVAAWLWEFIARRKSIIVIAGPSGVGKTTLLTALADFLPTAERLHRVRGAYDPLTFLEDDTVESESTTVMVNEISPHLPVYLWGPGVARLLTSQRRFRMFATAHASSARDLVAQLAGYPLRVPLAGLARLDVVVRIDACPEGGEVRRAVTEISAFELTDRDGILLHPLFAADSNSIDEDAVSRWLGEAHGRGGGTSVAVRHNILVNWGHLVEPPGNSDLPLKSAFAAAFARALGDT